MIHSLHNSSVSAPCSSDDRERFLVWLAGVEADRRIAEDRPYEDGLNAEQFRARYQRRTGRDRRASGQANGEEAAMQTISDIGEIERLGTELNEADSLNGEVIAQRDRLLAKIEGWERTGLNWANEVVDAAAEVRAEMEER